MNSHHRQLDIWVTRHAKIIIRAPNLHKILISLRMRRGKRLGETVNVVKIAIRLVILLLLDLFLEERFVRKGTSRGTLSFLWGAFLGRFGGRHVDCRGGHLADKHRLAHHRALHGGLAEFDILQAGHVGAYKRAGERGREHAGNFIIDYCWLTNGI